MKLSEDNSKAILLDIHQDISDVAEHSVSIIFDANQNSLTYPPNVELTAEEIAALKTIVPTDFLRSALKKILSDNSAGVIFNLLNNIDGTTDPKNGSDNWTGVKLVDLNQDEDSANFLHDKFYETYWDSQEN